MIEAIWDCVYQAAEEQELAEQLQPAKGKVFWLYYSK